MASTVLAAADQSVYSGKLENGWQNWSWAKVKLGKTISVDSKDWQGVYFHHAAMKSTFKSVTFRVDGGKAGGQRLQLRATVNGKPLKEAFLPVLKPGWTTITVQFKSLGLTGQVFDGFWIQAQKATTYQVADVVLKS